MPADHLALLAHLLHGRTNLHRFSIVCRSGRVGTGVAVSVRTDRLLVPIRDAATTQVVGGELHLDAITRQDPDVVHSHLARDVREHLVPILELDAEHGVGQRFDNRSFHQDRVVLGLGQGSFTTYYI